MIMELLHTFYYENFWQYELVFICRLILALFLGGLIGMERQWKKGKAVTAAGFRTHILVTVGACVFILTSISMPLVAETMGGGIINNADPGRIAAQAVSGIGFIGAGAILHSKGGRIRGLTTAASLWVAAAIGLAVGAGLYLTSIATTILTLITLRWFSKLEEKADQMLEKRTLCCSGEECSVLTDEIGAENILYVEQLQRADAAKEKEL
ncbi:MAG: MgtC/SapB family protein [Peptococcaceae bacterium]|nr:MgtC/SapB family protein [Peptococcaceae bacterium]